MAPRQSFQQSQSQSLKHTQSLMMSPQMQQARRYLQMPIMEMLTVVKAELEENPVLEEIENDIEEEHEEEEEQPVEEELSFDDNDFEIMQRLDDDFRDHFAESGNVAVKRSSEEEKLKLFSEQSIRDELSLFEFLMRQARETFNKGEEQEIAELLIGSLDERGILDTPLTELVQLNGYSIEDVEEVLRSIQQFEPVGVGARSLQESLLIQLRAREEEDSLAYRIVEHCYDDLIHNRIPTIAQKLQCSKERVSSTLKQEIAKLDLKPGTGYGRQVVQAIVPDATLIKEGDHLKVEIERDVFPTLRLNARYMQMLRIGNLSKDTELFIKKKLMSAKWLIRNVYQRNDTLERVVGAIGKHQHEFFMEPNGQLQPLTMKVLADELDLHESTIARTVANKAIETPRGLLPLRYFFSNAYTTDEGEDISSKTVRQALQKLIDGEDKKKPLSDAALSKVLQEKGIPCARRTLAKYRAELNIGNAQQRRRYC